MYKDKIKVVKRIRLRVVAVLIIGVVAVLIIGVLASMPRYRIIEDGQVGVQFDFGHIVETPIDTGWHWFNKWFTTIEVWSIKTQELKERANVPSSEGLISTLDVSIIWNIPKEQAVLVRKTIGYDFVQKVLEPYVRESIRNVASGYEVKALFSDAGRKEIGVKMLDFLKSKLDSRGIIVQDVLLRDVSLPQVFSDSIQMKLKTEQEALQKQFELQKAEKDAEIAVAHARGVAESNKIIANSITEAYLRYLWINGMQTSEKQIVYIPTEGNLPILEATRFNNNLGK